MQKTIQVVKDYHGIFGSWLRSPRTTGAIMPSGPFLSRALAREVHLPQHGWVVELGAGTGVVTRALLEHGVRRDRFAVVEYDTKLCHMLTRQFPGVLIINGDAKDLSKLLHEHGIDRVHALVSSLPFLTFPKRVRRAVVKGVLEAVPEHGALIQFTYGLRSNIIARDLERHSLSIAKRRQVLLNVPPASVWVYKRKLLNTVH